MSLTVIGTRSEDHVRLWKVCVRCEIGIIARNHVFWRGVVPCDVLFIGEGPGQTEDLTGTPFVGRAGKLLKEWEAECLGGASAAVANLVLCRPCDGPTAPNRPPTGVEVSNCRPRLEEFVFEIAKPKALVLLGRSASTYSPRGPLPTLELVHPAAINYKGGSGCDLDFLQRKKLAEFVRKEILK